MTYAFSFDASACSGCKACQEACKDKNNLPKGVLWRRVIEVTCGEWQRDRNGWENNVFAYYLSLACNHCTYPKCAGVCPTDAYSVRPDGIVLLDSSKCMGCGYCAWACPYEAPQYDAEQGIMTKCDFCYDNLEVGRPPSCVAACPLRVLDLGSIEDPNYKKGSIALWKISPDAHPFPLADYSHTEPHLIIKPHTGMNSALKKTVANQEEIRPLAVGKILGNSRFDEFPLVVFTLLVQMAVGLSVCMLAIPEISLPLLFFIGVILGFGGMASLLHLGRKRNAWRVLGHLRKSWLSREALLTGLFAIAWATTFGLEWLFKTSITLLPMAVVGCGLVYCMAEVYRLRTIISWNSWRTPVSFFLCATVLGTLAINILNPAFQWVIIAGIALAVELFLGFEEHSFRFWLEDRWRIMLIGLGLLGTSFIAFISPSSSWLNILVFLIALTAEAIGRQQFYSRRGPNPL
jgi:anaerobic dimethyl sulfoxide reductase subunit B (iron-sulfur subunit)